MDNSYLNRRTELIGKRIGKLTIIGPGPVRGNIKRSFWLCRCECGNEINVRETRLLTVDFPGCGCLRGQRIRTVPPEIAALKDRWSKAAVWRYYQYKQSARRRGLVFSIPEEDFEQLCKQDCFYCGAPPHNISRVPNRDKGEGRRQKEFKYNGLDRVDNDRGYCRENVVPCCITCNRAKRAMSQPDFLAWVERVHNHLCYTSLRSVNGPLRQVDKSTTQNSSAGGVNGYEHPLVERR